MNWDSSGCRYPLMHILIRIPVHAEHYYDVSLTRED